MASSFRNRLECFYCGFKSAQRWTAGLKKWQCKKCEAVNHLDENGEIADPSPMAKDKFVPVQYAKPIARSSSPLFDTPEDSLFCKICLKNQHMYNQTLAEYFPSEDTPNFEEYEKEYPRFLNRLQQQYPQLCEDCEPKVQGRLRATNYAAKTDHLRRMMDKTRGTRVPHHASSWIRFTIFLGGLLWAVSWAGQILWNGVRLWMATLEYDGLIDEAIELSASSCVQQAISGVPIASACIELVDWVARLALILSFLTIWWNPRLQENLGRRGRKIAGKKEYYFVQLLMLGARCATYAYLTQASKPSLVTQVLHAASLFLGLLLNATSFRSIRADYHARFTFKESPEPKIPQRTQLATHLAQPQQRISGIYAPQIRSTFSPFSIADFAPQPQQQHSPANRPPTPPRDDHDDEVMDWTPSQESHFRPATLYRNPNENLQHTVQQTQPSPFHGHLSPNVVSPAHRLRNPPNQPTFRKASAKQKQSFFTNPNNRTLRDSESVESRAKSATTEFSPAKFANPKFFPRSNNTDTGLEDILAQSFSIAEEPAEIRETREQHLLAQEQRLYAGSPKINRTRACFILLFSAAFLIWFGMTRTSLAQHLPRPLDQHR